MQQNTGNKDKTCYYCGKKNHVKAECRIRERDMKKQSAAAAQGRSDASIWRTKSQKKDDKKDDTVPKTGGLWNIVPKDKDLLLSCIDQGQVNVGK